MEDHSFRNVDLTLRTISKRSFRGLYNHVDGVSFVSNQKVPHYENDDIELIDLGNFHNVYLDSIMLYLIEGKRGMDTGNYGLDDLVWPEKPQLYNVQERCGKEYQTSKENDANEQMKRTNSNDANEQMKKTNSTSDKDEIEIMFALVRPSREGVILKDSIEWSKRVLRHATMKSKGKQPLIEESILDPD
ncbi:hypothetical protein PVK06_005323 [Gossypium arboreum]|uniref:Uncharacterized protein n=1 Tax=Gossypium arboreum TaxID=29729 RepID=A0ABR0QUB0_GOSAR|nr:hypothetical protein PVK06_005323 [Gossypium arboreum]